jgi:hypothetical protein
MLFSEHWNCLGKHVAPRVEGCSRWNLDLLEHFPKIMEGQREGKSQPFLQMVLNKQTPILAYVVKRKTIFTLSTYSFIFLLQF